MHFNSITQLTLKPYGFNMWATDDSLDSNYNFRHVDEYINIDQNINEDICWSPKGWPGFVLYDGNKKPLWKFTPNEASSYHIADLRNKYPNAVYFRMSVNKTLVECYITGQEVVEPEELEETPIVDGLTIEQGILKLSVLIDKNVKASYIEELININDNKDGNIVSEPKLILKAILYDKSKLPIEVVTLSSNKVSDIQKANKDAVYFQLLSNEILTKCYIDNGEIEVPKEADTNPENPPNEFTISEYGYTFGGILDYNKNFSHIEEFINIDENIDKKICWNPEAWLGIVIYDSNKNCLEFIDPVYKGSSYDISTIKSKSSNAKYFRISVNNHMTKCYLSESNNSNNDIDDYIEGRILIFEDDFNSSVLDTSKWTRGYRQGFNALSELQYYTTSNENLLFEDSKAIFKAKRQNITKPTSDGSTRTFTWTSAMIESIDKFEQKYGRWEAKIKVPRVEGMFPAFWTMGGNHYVDYDTCEYDLGVTWSKCGEIDIMEWVPEQGYFSSNLHRDYGSGDVTTVVGTKQGVADSYYDEYHIFAMEWTAEKLEFFIDNISIGTYSITSADTMFQWEHFMMLNLALKSSVPSTVNELYMYIDWVRVYAPVDFEEYDDSTITTNKILLSNMSENIKLMPDGSETTETGAYTTNYIYIYSSTSIELYKYNFSSGYRVIEYDVNKNIVGSNFAMNSSSASIENYTYNIIGSNIAYIRIFVNNPVDSDAYLELTYKYN